MLDEHEIWGNGGWQKGIKAKLSMAMKTDTC